MAKHKEVSTEVNVNMTPMIDVTFQLIIFFILASQFASQALAKLQVPKPKDSQAIDFSVEKGAGAMPKTIVNIVPEENAGTTKDPRYAGVAKEYRIDGNPVALGDIQKITDMIVANQKKSGVEKKDYFVEVRGDKDVKFEYIAPVLKAIAAAGISKINLTAEVRSH